MEEYNKLMASWEKSRGRPSKIETQAGTIDQFVTHSSGLIAMFI